MKTLTRDPWKIFRSSASRLANRCKEEVLSAYLRSNRCVVTSPIHLIGLRLPQIENLGTITLSQRVQFCMIGFRSTFWTAASGSITIGDRTFLNQGLNVASELKIEIGSDCLIGEHVTIHDTSFHAVSPSRPKNIAPVKIGRNVWIGHRAIILPGVEIGDHAIIGAGAVVSSNISTRCVAVGVPAKVVSNFECEDDWRRG